MESVVSFNLYHGTTHDNAELIKNNREFTFKQRPNHWLGSGVYFFISDLEKAKWWGREACKRAQRNGLTNQKPKVLYIEGYSILREKLLDLDTETDRKKFDQFITALGTVENIGSKEIGRATYLDLYSKANDIIAIKSTFIKNKNFGNLISVGIYNTEPQFCIVDLSSINMDEVVYL